MTFVHNTQTGHHNVRIILYRGDDEVVWGYQNENGPKHCSPPVVNQRHGRLLSARPGDLLKHLWQQWRYVSAQTIYAGSFSPQRNSTLKLN